jgi:hypothetical protein
MAQAANFRDIERQEGRASLSLVVGRHKCGGNGGDYWGDLQHHLVRRR